MPKSALVFTCQEIDSTNEGRLKAALQEVVTKYPAALVEDPEVSVDKSVGMAALTLTVEAEGGELFALEQECLAALQRFGLLLLET